MNRRGFLRALGASGLLVAGGAALTACGTSSESSSNYGVTKGDTKYGTVPMQLGWIKNAQFAGEYFADAKGYYRQSGMNVNLIAGGAAATGVEAGIDTGKVWVGTSTPQNVGSAIAKGVPVTIVGATMQTSPNCILSPAAKPISSPRELKGLKVGVSDHNVPVFTALLKANGMSADDVTIVPVQYDPSPLANGEVDAMSAFVTNEPITLAAKGFQTHYFMYGDHGLDMAAQVFVVPSSAVREQRDMVRAFLTAEVRGWRDAIANPAAGAALTVNTYGAGQKLDQSTQTKLLQATVPLISTPHTATHGLFLLTDEQINRNITSLRGANIDVEAHKLFDMSVLTELYSGDKTLI
ncbi:ABC transporter substrate-binding protein [Gordonia sp. 852002-50816_SCH5313054-c]|nr:ABC transporter substrate-binding protein [Gordonia sp. 852002-50816_SCH5313054-a]OBC19460.1 ABC transporter substrate-binding protein [Gordonia sp. 852002-50816_SCH5313054-c]